MWEDLNEKGEVIDFGSKLEKIIAENNSNQNQKNSTNALSPANLKTKITIGTSLIIGGSIILGLAIKKIEKSLKKIISLSTISMAAHHQTKENGRSRIFRITKIAVYFSFL